MKNNKQTNKQTCGMIDSFSLKSCNPISQIDTPSMVSFPLGSASRNKADINDDLPAPVRPTIPIYSNSRVKRLEPW